MNNINEKGITKVYSNIGYPSSKEKENRLRSMLKKENKQIIKNNT